VTAPREPARHPHLVLPHSSQLICTVASEAPNHCVSDGQTDIHENRSCRWRMDAVRADREPPDTVHSRIIKTLLHPQDSTPVPPPHGPRRSALRVYAPPGLCDPSPSGTIDHVLLVVRDHVPQAHPRLVHRSSTIRPTLCQPVTLHQRARHLRQHRMR
jgi:hypothetical protein